MMRILEKLLELIHRDCDQIIQAQRDAVLESAAAHRQAERVLAAERAENARLRERLDAAEHASRRALAVLREPMRLRHGCTEPLQASLTHQHTVWFGLTELANRLERAEYTDTAEKIRVMAEVHWQRLTAVVEVLDGDGPESAEELLAHLEQMPTWPLSVPAPRTDLAAVPATATARS